MSTSIDFIGTDTDIAALEQGLAGAPLDGTVVRAHLAWYLCRRDPRRAATLAAQALEEHERRGPPYPAARAAAARAELVLAYTQHLSFDFAGAGERMERARSAFRAVDDVAGEGDACYLLAGLANVVGKKAHWDGLVSEMADAYARCGDPLRQAIAELEKVQLLLRSDLAQARALLESSPLIRRCAGHPLVEATRANRLAHLAYGEGNYVQALAMCQLCHERALVGGSLVLSLRAAGNAAVTLLFMQLRSSALEWAEKSLAIARAFGVARLTAMALIRVAGCVKDLGRLEQAMALVQEAIDMHPESARTTVEWSAALQLRGEIRIEWGHLDLALDDLGEVELWSRKQWPSSIGKILPSRARTLSLLGRVDEALAALDECDVKSSGFELANALQIRADVARRHALPRPAGSQHASAPIHFMEAALAQLPETHRQQYVVWTGELAADYERAGDLARALTCERRAADAQAQADKQKAVELATFMQVREETERAQAQAAHHRALAQAEALRAEAEARANQAKSSFLANMSHELRSPLNAMLGFTRLLLRDPVLQHRRDDLAIVLRSGEHLHRLINQVLDMSKIEAGRLTLDESEFDLHALLDELGEMFSLQARDKGLHLWIVREPDLPRNLRCDALKLRQVLINLLGNAIKFTRQGSVELRVQSEPPWLRCAVTDTGVGIAESELARLGAAFVQAGPQAAEGTGLGLAISRGFAELMGGELRLQSTPGRGTRASFEVRASVVHPTREPAAVGSRRRPIGLAPGTPQPRILVADDLPEGRMLVTRLLTLAGFDVRGAADGEKTLEVWRQWRPHLVLMDMRMPIIDGREATRRIKASEQGRDTVVIALTASSFEEERDSIMAAGCDDYLRKPFDDGVLLETMARHLGLTLRYEDMATATTAPAASADATAARLAPGLLKRLAAALDRLDVMAIEEAMKQVREDYPAFATTLQPLLERFDYGKAAKLLQSSAPGDPAACPPAEA